MTTILLALVANQVKIIVELAERVQVLEEKLALLKKNSALFYRISYKELDEEDWAESWKAFFEPQKIGEKIVIKVNYVGCIKVWSGSSITDIEGYNLRRLDYMNTSPQMIIALLDQYKARLRPRFFLTGASEARPSDMPGSLKDPLPGIQDFVGFAQAVVQADCDARFFPGPLEQGRGVSGVFCLLGQDAR